MCDIYVCMCVCYLCVVCVCCLTLQFALIVELLLRVMDSEDCLCEYQCKKLWWSMVRVSAQAVWLNNQPTQVHNHLLLD